MLWPAMAHRIIVLAALAALALAPAGCSSGSGGSLGAADGGPPVDGSSAADGASPGDATSDQGAATPEAGTAPGGDDGGSSATDAGADASPCVPLGGPCKDTTTCMCGPGSGCAVDNVTCSDAGVCALAYTFTSGSTCCETCELAYDGDGGSFAAWTACNDACGLAGCPMRCVAQ
jgi:hypothetical protein